MTATGNSGTVVETQFDDSIAQGSFGTNHHSGNTELTISASSNGAGSFGYSVTGGTPVTESTVLAAGQHTLTASTTSVAAQ